MINYLISIKNKYKFSRISSAIIQAEFYARCREEKIICYLEFKENNSRFDALIFDDFLNKKFIIEFKSYRDASKKPITNTKQINKYKKFDLPIILITRIEQIDEAIEFLKKELKK